MAGCKRCALKGGGGGERREKRKKEEKMGIKIVFFFYKSVRMFFHNLCAVVIFQIYKENCI